MPSDAPWKSEAIRNAARDAAGRCGRATEPHCTSWEFADAVLDAVGQVLYDQGRAAGRAEVIWGDPASAEWAREYRAGGYQAAIDDARKAVEALNNVGNPKLYRDGWRQARDDVLAVFDKLPQPSEQQQRSTGR